MWCVKCAREAGVDDVQSQWVDLATQFECHNCGEPCGAHGVQGWDVLLAECARTGAKGDAAKA